ncbi:hypothetical protein [Alteribacter natronophilus]|uniref:hypothetical protein n=1 Tax=Alteribacter natronophilus TaxID=2583810 RepID=UPI00110F4DFE|nr:hypothetical protein [Alteribacter natronophilus]TMW71457.1 hypothetical protein FGB90_10450 [Alteribacter natronophilus]
MALTVEDETVYKARRKSMKKGWELYDFTVLQQTRSQVYKAINYVPAKDRYAVQLYYPKMNAYTQTSWARTFQDAQRLYLQKGRR